MVVRNGSGSRSKIIRLRWMVFGIGGVLMFFLLETALTTQAVELDVILNSLEKTELLEWREEILNGISVLPKKGYPGRLVVFGKHAEPILTGNNEEDVLVAAAEFGNGRIVAISHTSYGAKIAQGDNTTTNTMKEFHHNLKKWLTKGKFENDTSIINAKEDSTKEKLMSSKIVLFNGGQGKINSTDLIEFVRNGGALLHCLTPWGWLHINKGKTLSHVPYADLLNEVGLSYTGDFISVQDSGFSVKDNKAKDAHLLRVLKEAETNFSKAVEKVNMLNRLKYVPKNVFLLFKSNVERLWEICREEIKNITIPSAKTPANNKTDLGILNLWLLNFDLFQPANIKAPGVNFFPGDFTNQPPLKCYTLEFHSDKKDFHSTGYYLPAGQTLKVEVISGNSDNNWQIMIGCHKDELKKDKLRRWPKITKKVKLISKNNELSTPFGGLIYFISPGKTNQSINVKLENVVDSPRFRLTEGEKANETWERSRQSPGLWADIVGELITITLPASSVRELEFDALTSVMKTWDSVVRLYHDLRGTEISKHRRMWIVTDEQPSAGYMHSGHPIVTHMNVAKPDVRQFLLNISTLQEEGRWGIFHEMGHNMQRSQWTFEGTGEVTANIFTLCAMDAISHQKPWIHKGLQSQLKSTEKFFKDGADFKKWKSSPFIALFVYAQFAHEFGWESYRKVFRRYEAMTDSERPKDDQEKIDKWFLIFSEAVGFNLAPLAIFWAIPLSEEAVASLNSTFPVGFLPDDEVTRFAPDRVDAVLLKFPGTVRKTF